MPSVERKIRKNENFARSIVEKSDASSSKIVLALDLDFRQDTSRLYGDAIAILNKTEKYLCSVKLNFHLIMPLSLAELTTLNGRISSLGLTSIADIKLNDIANTNRVATEYLWKAGFSAVIANPFVGYEEGLDVVLERAHLMGKGVILLGYMSHKGAREGYDLKLAESRKMYELMLSRARRWKADGVIVGTTRPEKISRARKILGSKVKIFSPGSGAQGGNPMKALEAGSDYLIFGRSIVQSENPGEAVREIYRSQLAWRDNR